MTAQHKGEPVPCEKCGGPIAFEVEVTCRPHIPPMDFVGGGTPAPPLPTFQVGGLKVGVVAYVVRRADGRRGGGGGEM